MMQVVFEVRYLLREKQNQRRSQKKKMDQSLLLNNNTKKNEREKTFNLVFVLYSFMSIPMEY
jgi:hypothetical protein